VEPPAKEPAGETPAELRETLDRLVADYAPLKSKHDAWKAGKGPTPTVDEYQRIAKLAQSILDVRKGRAPIGAEASPDWFKEWPSLTGALEEDLNARWEDEFKEPGTFSFAPPELPEGLTREHLEAVNELFPGAFTERLLPTAPELRNLDKGYIDTMYPAEAREEDKKRGLTSFRPGHWDQAAESKYVSEPKETWGSVFTRSMGAELKEIGGSLVLLDTAIKPIYKSGKQHYGSVDGTDPSKDPLLPLFKEAFGKDANRFSHSWSELNDKLLPLAKKKIAEAMKSRGLAETDFDVILAPAILDNIEMTFNNPESSTTNTWEWTSTVLLDKDNKPTDRRLAVGRSVLGGAGGVDFAGRADALAYGGARLAVVFKKRA
jgi:hypothetical protein